ncbi:N-formylglutamate amidohydrolase [Sulfitobacter sp. D35]|uniref:N-formylglutamate amidohydrolase n=1 Tax=Sulfitobacter sp. D35 TaxID=3083252 RepID=UPI00296F28E1|nr:N-formylglutamate amidohydrolase [Sulfitobacter sp. D35]MDW4499679.1 N-formylglutamate amidohydrolase [Sulfitobacter sp. D35]
MSDLNHYKGRPANVIRPDGASGIVLVCEHACNFIPKDLRCLGLSPEVQVSHAAWDPGAFAVAMRLSESLDAPLIFSGISRLVYDCNRPPDAPGAMPEKSEVFDIPGNRGMSTEERLSRVASFYEPFRATLAKTIVDTRAQALVTVHSFTPVYMGARREVEIGVLHDEDARLANAMLDAATAHTDLAVRRNAPYGPEDGVTHTLREHGLSNDLPNVMIEVRNDLIADAPAQDGMASMLSGWIAAALAGPAAQEVRA